MVNPIHTPSNPRFPVCSIVLCSLIYILSCYVLSCYILFSPHVSQAQRKVERIGARSGAVAGILLAGIGTFVSLMTPQELTAMKTGTHTIHIHIISIGLYSGGRGLESQTHLKVFFDIAKLTYPS